METTTCRHIHLVTPNPFNFTFERACSPVISLQVNAAGAKGEIFNKLKSIS